MTEPNYGVGANVALTPREADYIRNAVLEYRKNLLQSMDHAVTAILDAGEELHAIYMKLCVPELYEK